MYDATIYNCLEYLIAHRGGVIKILPEVATNRMVPLLSSLYFARCLYKLYYLLPKKIYVFVGNGKYIIMNITKIGLKRNLLAKNTEEISLNILESFKYEVT